MRYLSLFSGIEAATVALSPLGWECAAVSEILEKQSDFLSKRYPHTRNLGDVAKIGAEDIKSLGQIDLVIFGSPCQGLSVAGKKMGFGGATNHNVNSALFFEGMRVAGEAVKHAGCRFVCWENVPGAFSSGDGRDFAQVVGSMAGLSDVRVPANGWGSEGVALGSNGLLEWCCLDAQWFGVAQRRRRVFALLDTGDWQSRKPVLLESDGERGHFAPRRLSQSVDSAGVPSCFGIPGNWIGRKEKNGGNSTSPMIDLCPNLTKTDHHGVAYRDDLGDWHVRRMTLGEVLTAQGFAPDYLDEMDAAESYKIAAVGRSMAVPVIRWIGKKIAATKAVA